MNVNPGEPDPNAGLERSQDELGPVGAAGSRPAKPAGGRGAGFSSAPDCARAPGACLVARDHGADSQADERKQRSQLSVLSAVAILLYNAMILAQEYTVPHNSLFRLGLSGATAEKSVTGVHAVGWVLGGSGLPRVSMSAKSEVLAQERLGLPRDGAPPTRQDAAAAHRRG